MHDLMTIEIRVPTEDQWPDLVRADGRSFGMVPTDAEIAERRPIIDLDRFRIAVDSGRIIGVAGSFSFDVTVPGGATMPASGVTWVAVSPTHRRRGVLTQMIASLHADAEARGEPVALLFASQGGIYGRFGYGVASQLRGVSIDTRVSRLRPDLRPDLTSVRFVEGDEASDHLAATWDRYRRSRPGEISRDTRWHDSMAAGRSKPDGEFSPAFHLAHRDGCAAYRINGSWTNGNADYAMELVEFVATTADAHLDLWATLLGVDLVTRIRAWMLPSDEALPYLLTDARAYATTALKDGLWANVIEPGVAFGARTYGTTDRLVVEADGVRWAIEADGDESSCRRVRTKPDLVTDHASLGSLLFAGTRPSALAAGRRLTARTPDALRRADAFFLTGPAPLCSTWF